MQQLHHRRRSGEERLQVPGIGKDGEVAIRRKLRRSQVLVEACCGAHHWARVLTALGHGVRLMPASYVKPNGKRGKRRSAKRQRGQRRRRPRGLALLPPAHAA